MPLLYHGMISATEEANLSFSLLLSLTFSTSFINLKQICFYLFSSDFESCPWTRGFTRAFTVKNGSLLQNLYWFPWTDQMSGTLDIPSMLNVYTVYASAERELMFWSWNEYPSAMWIKGESPLTRTSVEVFIFAGPLEGTSATDSHSRKPITYFLML